MQTDKDYIVLDETLSVCPECLKVVAAKVVVRGNRVYLDKSCPEHGSVSTYYWPDAEHYQWMSDFYMPYKKPSTAIIPDRGCPADCGLCMSHKRRPTLVEIEVTHQCNLRCPVCFMEAESARTQAKPDPDMKQLEGMFRRIIKDNGSQTSIQLTGGEPTTRKNLAEIVRLGREVGFDAIEVNTNGVVIGKDPAFIQELAHAGISGIYLQFDGLDSEVYKKVRGADLLNLKLQAIENCRRAGIQVVLAMTVIAGVNDNQLGAVLNYALQNRDVIAGIAYQPAFGSGRFEVSVERRLSMGDVIFMLAKQSNGIFKPYDFWPLGCSHPLCSSAAYLVEENGELEPFNRRITPREYMEAFDYDSPQGSVFLDIALRKFPELNPGLSIVVMNYMDAMSLDLKRLKECSMIVMNEENKFVPFCSYQLSTMCGKMGSE